MPEDEGLGFRGRPSTESIGPLDDWVSGSSWLLRPVCPREIRSCSGVLGFGCFEFRRGFVSFRRDTNPTTSLNKAYTFRSNYTSTWIHGPVRPNSYVRKGGRSCYHGGARTLFQGCATELEPALCCQAESIIVIRGYIWVRATYRVVRLTSYIGLVRIDLLQR